MPKKKSFPPYLNDLREFLVSDDFPDDVSYVMVVQRDGDENPTVLSNLDTSIEAAQALRRVVKAMGGDA